MIYLEEINFLTFFILVIKILKFNKNKTIYYIYSKKLDFMFIFIFKYLFRISLKKLNFKMMDIKNFETEEIIREIIPRNDLYIFEKKIKKNYNFFNNNKLITNFFLKSIIGQSAHLRHSFFRLIFLINVVYLLNKKNYKNNIFVINSRSWFSIFSEYSNSKNINLIQTSYIINKKTLLYLFKIIYFKNLLKDTFIIRKKKYLNSNIKLYCEGKSQPNLNLNGERSDFSWLIESNFPRNNVAYNTLTFKTKNKLNSYGIYTTLNFERNKFYYKNNNYKFINKNLLNINEKLELNKICNNFDFSVNFWYSYFKTHNIKITLNWYKYDSSHIAQSKAISLLNGISTMQQLNFEGHRNYFCKSIFDICFYFSKFSADNDYNNGSNIKYKIITGIPNYEINEMNISNANKIRNYLKNNGVQKIACVLDENSLDDERFHTGHSLQKENYYLIINEMLRNKKLGLIFKPKNPSSLRKRLGKYNTLLDQAIKTGRCHIFESYEREGVPFSKITPLQAALSSDLVIHSSLSAGTAALETASNRIPTIMIDREKNYESIFYKKLNNNIIFKDWFTALGAMNEYFFGNEYNNLGNWKENISHFDPFLDNLSQQRMGNFLNHLIEGFNKGLDRDENLNNAIIKYSFKWGEDKVIIN